MPNIKKEMDFLHLAQNLKTELRHCWYTDGRRESVAEHSWRLALMVIRFANQLDQPIDTFKCLKMALVHDLPEAIAKDLPVTLQNVETKALQFQKEKDAIEKISQLLGDSNGHEIRDLWYEYENQNTYESRFMKALDKLEAWIQHNEACITTWELREKEMVFQDKYLMKYCEFDSFLKSFAEEVIKDAIQKLQDAGENLTRIRESAFG